MELREWVGRTDLAQAIIPVTVRAGTSVSNTILTLYHLPALIFREGNATPLQYSCLENPMGGGAWWAAVHGVAKVGHDWVTWLSLFTFLHWRRKWQPAPVFLPGESQGRGSLLGCRLWGRTELDTTEVTEQQQQQQGLNRRRRRMSAEGRTRWVWVD